MTALTASPLPPHLPPTALFAVGVVLAALRVVVGCSHQAPTQAQVAAEGAYGAALLRCVDQAKTLADSKACRAKVNAEWGVVEVSK